MWLFELFFPQFCKSDVEVRISRSISESTLEIEITRVDCIWHKIDRRGIKINGSAIYKSNKMACAPSEDSCKPGHPPSLIRVFAVRMKKAWILSYPLSAQRRIWSDWADAQADRSLCWAHMPFCWYCHALAQICFLYLLTAFPQPSWYHHYNLSYWAAPRKRVPSWSNGRGKDLNQPT